MLIHLFGTTTPPDDPGHHRAKPSRVDEGEEWWDPSTGRVYFKFNALIYDHYRTAAPGDRLKRAQMRKAIEDLGGEVSVRITRPDKAKGEKGWQVRVCWVECRIFEEEAALTC